MEVLRPAVESDLRAAGIAGGWNPYEPALVVELRHAVVRGAWWLRRLAKSAACKKQQRAGGSHSGVTGAAALVASWRFSREAAYAPFIHATAGRPG